MQFISGLKVADNKSILGVDWSRTSVEVYDPRTGKVKSFPSLEKVAQAYPDSILFLEATAESFQLQRRAVVLNAFEKNGIDAYVFKSQWTSKFRIKWGVKKTDKNDAKVIYRIGTETKISVSRFKPLKENDELRKAIKNTLVEDRYLYDGKPSQELAKQYLDKAIIPVEFESILVDKKTKKGRTYRASVGRILQVAVKVREAGRGYREFRRQVGNYSNGYESMPRSEHNWHLTIYEVRRRLKAAGIKATKMTIADPKTGEKQVRVWSDAELVVKKEVQKTVVKASQFLWRLTGVENEKI